MGQFCSRIFCLWKLTAIDNNIFTYIFISHQMHYRLVNDLYSIPNFEKHDDNGRIIEIINSYKPIFQALHRHSHMNNELDRISFLKII